MALLLLVMLSYTNPLGAQFPAVTQGYGSEGFLQRGMIVRLNKADPTKVEALSSADIDHMHGVVVDANDAPVTLSTEDTRVYVATVGRYDVLVSDQNGPINNGDNVTISSLNGIGMRATSEQRMVIGKAVSSFDGSSRISTSELQTQDGQQATVNIGRLQVDIAVSTNPLLRTSQGGVPDFLLRAGEQIANKPVNPVKIYVSLAILLISTAIAGSLLYGGVRSSIVAIGRNPLSRRSIGRSLWQVVLTAFIVFIIGLFGVYLLLKL